MWENRPPLTGLSVKFYSNLQPKRLRKNFSKRTNTITSSSCCFPFFFCFSHIFANNVCLLFFLYPKLCIHDFSSSLKKRIAQHSRNRSNKEPGGIRVLERIISSTDYEQVKFSSHPNYGYNLHPLAVTNIGYNGTKSKMCFE